MNPSLKLDQFLGQVFDEDGPDGVTACFSFLFGAFEITRDGVVIGASEDFVDLIEYPRQELIGMHATDLITPDERGPMLTRFERNDSTPYKLKLLCKGEKVKMVRVAPRVFHVRGETYRLAEFVDISDDIENQERLRASEEQFYSVFNLAAVGIARVTPDGHWIESNRMLSNIVGYRREELAGMSLKDLAHPDDIDTDLSLIDEVLIGERDNFTRETRYIHKSGRTIWVQLSVSLIRQQGGAPGFLIAVIEDISVRKAAEEDLQYQVTHDPLTGLGNRAALDRNLRDETERAARYQRCFSLLMLDIDHFKAVNDTYGHPEGDQVLIKLAEILDGSLRESDFSARFGGEEFLVLLPEIDHAHALLLGERIRLSVASAPIQTRNNAIAITVSIGVASFPAHGDTPGALTTAVDEALYVAKAGGRNRVASADDR